MVHGAPAPLATLRAWSHRRGPRGGYSVLELMVVIAILIALVVIMVPTLNALTAVEQRRVAKQLALTYTHLYDQAIMRNTTFRIAYHLDANYYAVEVGDPDVLIFDDPEQRLEHEKEVEDKLQRFKTQGQAVDEYGADVSPNDFQTVSARFEGKVQLPRGTVFGGVYTPQYGWVEPSGDGEEDPEHPNVVYSHLFKSGFSEPTVVWIVDEKDPTEGFSVVVEPLSGVVTLSGELVDWEDAFDDLPQDGPKLP